MSNANRSSTASTTAPSVSGSSHAVPDSPDDQRWSAEADPIRPSLQSPPAEGVGSIYEPKILTMVLVLCSKEKEIEEQYAVVPFPETYEAAVTSTIKSLGTYMSDPRPDNIILRCSTKNRKGEWVWADILPEDWKAILELNRTEVGVFEKHKKTHSPESLFIHGTVFLTVGSKNTTGMVIVWTNPQDMSCARPKTFSHAVEILNTIVQSAFPAYWLPREHDLENMSRIRFCTFPHDNLSTWQVIPLEAHLNDDTWRTLVPKPGKYLGVMAE